MNSKSYDNYYLKENYFGNPYPGLIKFFETYPERNKILDLGCGQGRDSLFLGRIGYHVMGVDASIVGIQQLNKAAKSEQLQVESIVSDIYTYPITEEYDIILLDSIFHFYKNDIEKETNLLIRIAKELKSDGVLCIFMQKGDKRENHLKNIIFNLEEEFVVLCDDYTVYPDFNSYFHIYIIKKK